MKLPLFPQKDIGKAIPWTSCSPFVENSRAVLIHRPRHVTTHKIGPMWKSHIAITYWCGACTSGRGQFTFLDAPPDGKLLCARCEHFAVKNIQPSSFEIIGRHAHVGGVVPIQLCCKEVSP